MRHLSGQRIAMTLFTACAPAAAVLGGLCLAAVLKWNNILPAAGVIGFGFIAAWVLYESSFYYLPGNE